MTLLGPSTRVAKDVISDYRSKELCDPDYQREYIWTNAKARNFLKRTIKLGHVLGVITTYRLDGGTVNFLQDGKQRVTTLRMAFDNPSNFSLSKEDADVLRIAQISQQTMCYESHDEARLDFQHLNDGVGLIPYEKYRGDLECDPEGKDLYELVRSKVHGISVDMAGTSRSVEPSRKKAGQLHRHSLGLFYQYATKHKEHQLYANNETSLNEQIERRVVTWLRENRCEWRAKFDNFVQKLESINAVLHEKTRAHALRRWDMTAVRALYAANIHLKNIGCNTDSFSDLVDWFISRNVSRKNWPSRFEVDVLGEPIQVRLNQLSLKWMGRLEGQGCPALGPQKRTQLLLARAGYDESHIIPHADGGTETVSEPSSTNRARGRQPIQ